MWTLTNRGPFYWPREMNHSSQECRAEPGGDAACSSRLERKENSCLLNMGEVYASTLGLSLNDLKWAWLPNWLPFEVRSLRTHQFHLLSICVDLHYTENLTSQVIKIKKWSMINTAQNGFVQSSRCFTQSKDTSMIIMERMIHCYWVKITSYWHPILSQSPSCASLAQHCWP